MAKSDISAERLHTLFRYEPETGRFHRAAGGIAGRTERQGYVVIIINRQQVGAHRLAWLWMTGHLPVADIDHINGDRADNRWVNLRSVDRAVNAQNQRRGHRGSISGLLGAHWNKVRGKWVAAIMSRGRRYTLGAFGTKEEAHAAYLDAKRRLHDGCTI